MRLIPLIACLLVTPVVAEDKVHRLAITGDTLIVDNTTIRLKDTECPPFTTDEGRAAKLLVTAMLRAPLVECAYVDGPEGNVGDCIYRTTKLAQKARSMVDELRKRNLCQPRTSL